MNIFESMYEVFKFKKKTIRLFEAFAGIGTQAMALKRLGVDIEHIGISEIDKYALASYYAIHGNVKNYGSITDIKGADLPQIDLFTWSFPCTDLSKAGKQKGLENTRSGLGYEVLRIVNEMKVKPTVLVMENVPDLLSPKFKEGWHEMYNEIENMGYSNYVETLNAKHYGVAQNRDRVFMVSILGDYYYEFPKPLKLEKRLKDYLESDVDEKYYLSEKHLEHINKTKRNVGDYIQYNRFNGQLEQHSRVYNKVAPTLTTKSNDVKISYAIHSREHKTRGWLDISPTLCARDYKDPKIVLVPEATKQGYAKAEEGDGVYINRPHQKRGVVQKQMIQTLKANGNDVGVVSKDLRIRKLSPRECWRLMGIDDEDFEKAEKVVSNSQLYKQAGNAIVVDVLCHIFNNLIH